MQAVSKSEVSIFQWQSFPSFLETTCRCKNNTSRSKKKKKKQRNRYWLARLHFKLIAVQGVVNGCDAPCNADPQEDVHRVTSGHVPNASVGVLVLAGGHLARERVCNKVICLDFPFTSYRKHSVFPSSLPLSALPPRVYQFFYSSRPRRNFVKGKIISMFLMHTFRFERTDPVHRIGILWIPCLCKTFSQAPCWKILFFLFDNIQ